VVGYHPSALSLNFFFPVAFANAPMAGLNTMAPAPITALVFKKSLLRSFIINMDFGFIITVKLSLPIHRLKLKAEFAAITFESRYFTCRETYFTRKWIDIDQ